MSNKTRDELERSFDCCGLFNLTTLYQQDYDFCTAVSVLGVVQQAGEVGNWVRTMPKLANLVRMSLFLEKPSCIGAVYWWGVGVDKEAGELAKSDFSL